MIRTTDGRMVDLGVYRAMKVTARAIISDELYSLPILSDHPRTMVFYRKFYPHQWETAILRLEEREPLIGLCAAHWKAEYLLGSLLLANASNANRKKRRLEEQNDAESESTSESTRTDNAMPHTKHCNRSGSTSGKIKRRRLEERGGSSLDLGM